MWFMLLTSCSIYCALERYDVHLFMIAIRKSQVPILGRLSYRIIAVWDLDTLDAARRGVRGRPHRLLLEANYS